MNAALRIFTPAEAAAVSEVGIKAVHNAIDKRIIDTVARTWLACGAYHSSGVDR